MMTVGWFFILSSLLVFQLFVGHLAIPTLYYIFNFAVQYTILIDKHGKGDFPLAIGN